MIKNDKLKSRLKKYIILKGDIMRSITKIELQYAHRFYGFKGEAQYLHLFVGLSNICHTRLELSIFEIPFVIH